MIDLFAPPPFPEDLVPLVAKLAGLRPTLEKAWETCFWAGFQAGAVAVGLVAVFAVSLVSLLIVGIRRRSPP